MTPYDRDAGAALNRAFDELVRPWPHVESRPMFGHPGYTAEGTLFAVLATDGVALTRLPRDQWGPVEESFETGPFQSGERTVGDWLQVQVDELDDLVNLRPYVRASYERARTESQA